MKLTFNFQLSRWLPKFDNYLDLETSWFQYMHLFPTGVSAAAWAKKHLDLHEMQRGVLRYGHRRRVWLRALNPRRSRWPSSGLRDFSRDPQGCGTCGTHTIPIQIKGFVWEIRMGTGVPLLGVLEISLDGVRFPGEMDKICISWI